MDLCHFKITFSLQINAFFPELLATGATVGHPVKEKTLKVDFLTFNTSQMHERRQEG